MDSPKITHFPITEGQYKGNILELKRTPEGAIVAKFEEGKIWHRTSSKVTNPWVITLYLHRKYKKALSISMTQAVFWDLMAKVRGYRLTHGNSTACKVHKR